MKVVIRVDLKCEEDGVVGYVTREVQMAFAPSLDIQYESRPWTGPRKPSLVQYDIDEVFFYVYFGLETFGTVDGMQHRVNDYHEDLLWNLHSLEKYKA
jgi:hypothetical protein